MHSQESMNILAIACTCVCFQIVTCCMDSHKTKVTVSNGVAVGHTIKKVCLALGHSLANGMFLSPTL